MRTQHLTILPPLGQPRLNLHGVSTALIMRSGADRTERVQRALALELYADASIQVHGTHDAQTVTEELLQAARFLIPECPDHLPRHKLLAHRSTFPLNEHDFFEKQIHKALLANGYVRQPGVFATPVALLLDDGDPTLSPPSDQVYVHPTPYLTCSARDWVLLSFQPSGLNLPRPRIAPSGATLKASYSPFTAADSLEVVEELRVAGQDVPWWFAEDDTLLLRGPVDVARSTLREHGPAIAAAWVYSTVARRGLEATYDEEGGEIHSDRLAQKWAEIFLQRYAPGESARLCQFHDERRHAMRLSHILEAVKTLPEALTKQAGLDCERLNATLTQLHADLDESRKHLPRL